MFEGLLLLGVGCGAPGKKAWERPFQLQVEEPMTEEDAKRLLAMGVARVYTPKDFELNMIMSDIVTLADPEAIAAE